MSLPKVMKAIVCANPGPVSVLQQQSIPLPAPALGEVLIKILGFGINRAEMYTRQGHSPITFPRIIGIECFGEVAGYNPEETQDPKIPVGSRVATCMGGLGREKPGSYAEYTCALISHVRGIPATTNLSVAQLAAMPEMLQTTYGALTAGLDVQPGDKVLVRGATSSIGLCALSLARRLGAVAVAGTTRSEARVQMLKDAGADAVFVEPSDGNLAKEVHDAVQNGDQGYSKILELTGTTTLRDSILCASEKGTVCMAGIQGGQWELSGGFAPITDIPNRVRLCAYGGGNEDFHLLPLEDLVRDADEGRLKLPSIKAWKLEDIQKIHEHMESGGGGSKNVVVVCDE